MKKRILTLSVAIITTISSAFANNTDNIGKNVTLAFSKDFSNAREVKWEKVQNLVKVTFMMNNQTMFAYYSAGGELLGLARNISPDSLPINQLTSLRKHYSDYWVSDLFELNADGESTYYITLENADSKMMLKSVNAGNWEQYSMKKKI